MTEETDAPQGGDEGINTLPNFVEQVVADEAEKDSVPAAEQPTGTDEPGPADDAGEATEEPPKRVPWFQKRIDEVTAQKYDAQRQADYWRGLAEGRTPQQPQTAQEVPDRWEDPDGYDQWLIKQAAQAARAELQQQQSFRSYEERENAVRQSKPDYDSIVRDPSLPITPMMAQVIRESESGPDVVYYLGTNRSEAQRIAGLSPHRQAAELGRIEANLSRPAPQVTKPIPHAPPQTVAGLSAGLSKTPEEMSQAEFNAWREAEEKTRN